MLAGQRLGIMAAMEQELAAIVAAAQVTDMITHGGRRFFVGILGGVEVVMVVSRIGKVAAATTATVLLERFGVGSIVFTGLAGAVATSIAIGDIVVATGFVHHDLDARPLFAEHEVPLLGVSELPVHAGFAAKLHSAATEFVATRPATLQELGIVSPQVLTGVIASGDQFFASITAVAELRRRLPNVLAVEMEGAAVAQVCYEHAIPFAGVRVVSDSADHNASVAFDTFLQRACGVYAVGIMARFVAATQ